MDKTFMRAAIPNEIHRKIKSLAALRGIKMQELWLEIIEAGLKSITKES